MSFHPEKYKHRTLFARLCKLYIFIFLCATNVNAFADGDTSHKKNEKYQRKQKAAIATSSNKKENTTRRSQKSQNAKKSYSQKPQKSQSTQKSQKSHSRGSSYYAGNYRYNDKRYPKVGYSVRSLPKKHYTSRFKNRDYFFNNGIWYASYGSDFRVVIAPAGIRVSRLPPAYSTVWHNRKAYYYANSTYYIWEPTYNSYVVVDKPKSIQTNEVPLIEEDLYIYPAQGQSDTQLADDRYACHARGRDATQYDPTSPPSGVSGLTLSNMRADYLSIMRGCLLELGYSVQ